MIDFIVLGDLRILCWFVVVICLRAQQVVSELQATLGILRIRRAPDLIRWRSCVDLRSEVLVFEEIVCRSQEDSGGLVESVVK